MTVVTHREHGTALPSQRGSRRGRRQPDPRWQRRANLQAASGGDRSSGLQRLPLVVLGVDLLLLALALVLAAVGQGAVARLAQGPTEFVPAFALAGPVMLVAWVSCIGLAGGYDRRSFGATAREFNRVLVASLAWAAVVGVGCYALRFDLSRAWFFLTFALGTTALVAGRLALRVALKRYRSHGLLQQRVVIVGDESHIEDVASVLERESWLGYDVVGALAPLSEATGNDGASTESGIPILGDTSDVAQTAIDAGAEVVFLAGGAVGSAAEMREIAWDLEHSDAQVVVAPTVTEVSAERVQVRPVGGLPLIHVDKPRAAMAARWAKRCFDVLGSLTLLVVFSPVFALAAFRIWRFDGGPVVFGHTRIGRDGADFTCLKFRSMAIDAEERLEQLLHEQGLEHGAFAKLKDDPRITKPGHWLRRYSIDELPQLWNVLRGDMSLVGPRPQTQEEVDSYDSAMSRRLHVRPGMTGLWQVSGRSDLPIEEAVRLDLYYVDNWSMMQDLAILVRTFRAVFGSRGAY